MDVLDRSTSRLHKLIRTNKPVPIIRAGKVTTPFTRPTLVRPTGPQKLNTAPKMPASKIPLAPTHSEAGAIETAAQVLRVELAAAARVLSMTVGRPVDDVHELLLREFHAAIKRGTKVTAAIDVARRAVLDLWRHGQF